jgi:hypothetical protein
MARRNSSSGRQSEGDAQHQSREHRREVAESEHPETGNQVGTHVLEEPVLSELLQNGAQRGEVQIGAPGARQPPEPEQQRRDPRLDEHRTDAS